MKAAAILITIVTFIHIVAYFLVINSPSPYSPQNTSKTQISLSEIARHSSTKDCWMAIEGKVYDVTSYIESRDHPGGAEIRKGCGKDATKLFNERKNKPNSPHSDNARADLAQYYIGELL